MSVFIIAEAGANHDRNLDQAFELVKVAKSAGANAVKFQTYSSETLYAENTPDFAGYKNINKLIKDIELPREWQKDIKLFCDDIGIEFMSTPFDEKAVEELYDLGVQRFKIAGFESTDPRIVKCVASTQLPLIITAGIGSNINTINKIIEWILQENSNPDITFLHGNNAYPTPFRDINLGQIKKLLDYQNVESFFKSKFKVGLSDHTEGILVPPLAVSMGATVIEKHYTISRSLEGPDHKFAIEPSELHQMVKDIRTTEVCLSEKLGELTSSEKNFSNARRSVVSKKDIAKGEILSKDNLTTMRPALKGSIPAMEFFNTFNKITTKPIKKGSVLFWEDIQ
ncbi:MAG: N-acetylneuraminate synthase [Flavobacteriaceae bacterium]|nr:N-acetylneuraminate synthase [Flavobacteriaceae bacterium]|tara:strand:- start:1283 stop:2302 length:1020 start_codon:yes stop_codon:yes gene_type:complete